MIPSESVDIFAESSFFSIYLITINVSIYLNTRLKATLDRKGKRSSVDRQIIIKETNKEQTVCLKGLNLRLIRSKKDVGVNMATPHSSGPTREQASDVYVCGWVEVGWGSHRSRERLSTRLGFSPGIMVYVSTASFIFISYCHLGTPFRSVSRTVFKKFHKTTSTPKYLF